MQLDILVASLNFVKSRPLFHKKSKIVFFLLVTCNRESNPGYGEEMVKLEKLSGPLYKAQIFWAGLRGWKRSLQETG